MDLNKIFSALLSDDREMRTVYINGIRQLSTQEIETIIGEYDSLKQTKNFRVDVFDLFFELKDKLQR
jgi:hypothetical protein